jgi:uncharacterized metal-binding protein
MIMTDEYSMNKNSMDQNSTDRDSAIKKKPIVYSCSGCSNLAQMAHDLASNLDRDGIAEMSCISGVIGEVEQVMALARSGRPIIAIDGCNLGCTKSCLDACNITPELHFDIGSYGFEKRAKEDNSLRESCIAISLLYDVLAKHGYTIDSKNLK